jgi:hypothetical protein
MKQNISKYPQRNAISNIKEIIEAIKMKINNQKKKYQYVSETLQTLTIGMYHKHDH